MDQQNENPTFAEIAEAMRTLQTPPEMGMAKHISTIIVAAILGLGAWMMTSLSTLQTSVTQMVTTVAAMQKTVDTMSARSELRSDAEAALQTKVATIDERLTEIERREGMNNGKASGH